MAKSKRPFDGGANESLSDVHSSRQKRIKYSDDDAQLAKIYNDLADEVQAVRIKAAGELLGILSKESPDQSARLDAAEHRLIKGLCSGRKAARLGFSVALTEILRLKLQPDSNGSINLSATLEKLTSPTTPIGNVSGQERRDYLLGRRFAFQTILESDVALRKELSDSQWREMLQCIFRLASEKPWLRRECGSMLYEHLNARGSKLPSSRVQQLVEVTSEFGQLKTPEGVGLWLVIQDKFPEIRLPKGLWSHNNPLSSKERGMLSKVLLEDAAGDNLPSKKSGTRQSSPSFVWQVILSHFQVEDAKHLEKFWESCVVSPMFSSTASTERRSLGLQIVELALSTAPASQLPTILDAHILRCVLDQRAKQDRYLFEAAKNTLSQVVDVAKQKPESAAFLLMQLLFKGAVNFDALTKTKTVESILQHANESALEDIVRAIVEDFKSPDVKHESDAEVRRRLLAGLLLTAVRLHKDSRTSLSNVLPDKDSETGAWLQTLLRSLSGFAYDDLLPSSTKDVIQARLMSCLNNLMDPPLEHACKAPVFTAWLVLKANANTKEIGERAAEVVNSAKSCLKKSYKRHTGNPSSQAFSMLLALSILQVYNGESDAVAVLEDLVACYEAKHDSSDSTTMLVELLLSFVSKPSSLFRKLAEQVFAVLAPEITADSLQSLTDILSQKESLTGQKELFDEKGDENGQELDEDEESEAMDVEDASDVELVNGEVPSEEDGEDESDASSEAEEGAAADDNDEEAAFDKKLADALGTAGMGDDSSEDGSDMDDDQMMELEPHLTTIFKERQQQSSKKQEKKDAKENIVNFKNRVLDLLMIYVKAQSSSILALDLIAPLTTLVRTTTSKPTAEKAYDVLRQYFDSCSKTKTLPEPEDHDACFTVLAALHEEIKLGGSKLHANACSRSSLFLAKVLVAIDRKHYERINEMYAKLQSEWYLNRKSKIQGSIFTEWTSWSISTRKSF